VSVIVLVHGIAQEQKSADSLEAAWLPALAGGIRVAGDPGLADQLWRAAGPGSLEARMAYYGDLFRRPGAQGAGEDDLPDAELADELAMAWLGAAAERGTPHDRAVAAQALAQVEAGPAGAQGRPALLRPAIKGLTRVRWFAPMGVAVAGRFVVQALGQVTRYLTDDVTRVAAVKRVHALIGPETRLVIGHSLGSVVAYEALVAGIEQPLTLITLGSPLGLRRVIYDRLRPQPQRVPPSVGAWTNIADVDDLVAAELRLRPLFPPAPGRGVHVDDRQTDNGSEPHAAERYLVKESVGNVVARAITG
jgi:hypothetical protein